MDSARQRKQSKYDHFIFSKTELRELTPELKRKAEVELRECPDTRMKDIEELRHMILECEPRLNVDTSDAFLIRYLRTAKYDKNRALKIMMHFFKMKENNRDILHDSLLPSKFKNVFKSNILTLLPQRDNEGRPIILFTLRQWNTSLLSLEDLFGILYLMGEKLLQDESVQIRGTVGILDLQGLSLHHIRMFCPVLAYKVITTIQDGFPVRIRGIHIIRESNLIDFIWPIIRTFIKPKIKKRMFFHGYDLNSLHKYIPKGRLPNELEGTQGPLDTTEWYLILHDSEEEYIQKAKFGFIR